LNTRLKFKHYLEGLVRFESMTRNDLYTTTTILVQSSSNPKRREETSDHPRSHDQSVAT